MELQEKAKELQEIAKDRRAWRGMIVNLCSIGRYQAKEDRITMEALNWFFIFPLTKKRQLCTKLIYLRVSVVSQGEVCVFSQGEVSVVSQGEVSAHHNTPHPLTSMVLGSISSEGKLEGICSLLIIVCMTSLVAEVGCVGPKGTDTNELI